MAPSSKDLFLPRHGVVHECAKTHAITFIKSFASPMPLIHRCNNDDPWIGICSRVTTHLVCPLSRIDDVRRVSAGLLVCQQINIVQLFTPRKDTSLNIIKCVTLDRRLELHVVPVIH